jgi:hypothetical protein
VRGNSPLPAIALVAIALSNASCSTIAYLWGIEQTRDLTNKKHGDFRIRAVYELRHGAYLFGDAQKREFSLVAPTRYAVYALDAAQREYGDARWAPTNYESLEAETRWAADGHMVLPPVESLMPSDPLPPKCLGTVPAGTRFQFVKLIGRFKGEQSGNYWYYARILGREELGDRVTFTSMTNYDRWGFQSQYGYGRNPFMIFEVGTDPTTLPAK